MRTFNPTFFGSLPLGWLPAAYTIGEIGIWAFKVILGMFAVSWYHDSSKAQIEEIYMACPEGDGRTELLVQRGGTNLLAALLYFGIMCLLQVAYPLHGRPQRDSVSYDHGGCINCPRMLKSKEDKSYNAGYAPQLII